MTVAKNPSPWYSRLSQYKTFNTQYRSVIAALTLCFLREHDDRIKELLGGDIDLITIVPSKRGLRFDEQPLRKTLSMAPDIESRLHRTLIHYPNVPLGRRDYKPAAFLPDRRLISDKRIVVIEDTWVTGATAVSAAGALLENGAQEVALLPIARMVEPGSPMFDASHPYYKWMAAPYDLSRWPR